MGDSYNKRRKDRERRLAVDDLMMAIDLLVDFEAGALNNLAPTEMLRRGIKAGEITLKILRILESGGNEKGESYP